MIQTFSKFLHTSPSASTEVSQSFSSFGRVSFPGGHETWICENRQYRQFSSGEEKMRRNVPSSSSRSPFSPEFVARQVPADHPKGVPFFPLADAEWHYANLASNAAGLKTEQAALTSAQASECRAAMDRELTVMDALGVFKWCFIPLRSNLITCN